MHKRKKLTCVLMIMAFISFSCLAADKTAQTESAPGTSSPIERLGPFHQEVIEHIDSHIASTSPKFSDKTISELKKLKEGIQVAQQKTDIIPAIKALESFVDGCGTGDVSVNNMFMVTYGYNWICFTTLKSAMEMYFLDKNYEKVKEILPERLILEKIRGKECSIESLKIGEPGVSFDLILRLTMEDVFNKKGIYYETAMTKVCSLRKC